ncbi:MAG TPA: hypothetical protein VFS00_34660, partial [Polyangiaceae bacterium]|nr:hypothetical protein [Polyangiaceae bacterium]
PAYLPSPARDAAVRLRAEAEAAGLDASEGEGGAEGELRATIVVRGDRPIILFERALEPPRVFHADDVPVDEAPAVVALRAVEWLKAELTPAPRPAPEPRPDAPAAATIGPPPDALASAAIGPRPDALASAASPYRRPFVSAAIAAALDGGATTLAPAFAIGTGVAGPAFVRLSGWGPSSWSNVDAPQGSARVRSFGAAASAGWTWPLGGSFWLTTTAGAGVTRYAVEGRSAPGFVARRATATSSLLLLDASVLRPLAGPVAGFLGVGANVALPSVGIRIADVRVAERGRPELKATLGVQLTF